MKKIKIRDEKDVTVIKFIENIIRHIKDKNTLIQLLINIAKEEELDTFPDDDIKKSVTYQLLLAISTNEDFISLIEGRDADQKYGNFFLKCLETLLQDKKLKDPEHQSKLHDLLKAAMSLENQEAGQRTPTIRKRLSEKSSSILKTGLVRTFSFNSARHLSHPQPENSDDLYLENFLKTLDRRLNATERNIWYKALCCLTVFRTRYKDCLYIYYKLLREAPEENKINQLVDNALEIAKLLFRNPKSECTELDFIVRIGTLEDDKAHTNCRNSLCFRFFKKFLLNYAETNNIPIDGKEVFQTISLPSSYIPWLCYEACVVMHAPVDFIQSIFNKYDKTEENDLVILKLINRICEIEEVSFPDHRQEALLNSLGTRFLERMMRERFSFLIENVIGKTHAELSEGLALEHCTYFHIFRRIIQIEERQDDLGKQSLRENLIHEIIKCYSPNPLIIYQTIRVFIEIEDHFHQNKLSSYISCELFKFCMTSSQRAAFLMHLTTTREGVKIALRFFTSFSFNDHKKSPLIQSATKTSENVEERDLIKEIFNFAKENLVLIEVIRRFVKEEIPPGKIKDVLFRKGSSASVEIWKKYCHSSLNDYINACYKVFQDEISDKFYSVTMGVGPSQTSEPRKAVNTSDIEECSHQILNKICDQPIPEKVFSGLQQIAMEISKTYEERKEPDNPKYIGTVAMTFLFLRIVFPHFMKETIRIKDQDLQALHKKICASLNNLFNHPLASGSQEVKKLMEAIVQRPIEIKDETQARRAKQCIRLPLIPQLRRH